MFKINLTITLGSLLKSRRLSMANVIGMMLRLSVAIGIGWWLWGEVNYSTSCERYDWLVALLETQIIDENIRTWLEQVLHGLNYMGDKYGYNLEQIVLVDWLGGRLIASCVEHCFRGRFQLQS